MKFTPSGSFSRSWSPTGSTADLKAVAVDDAADKIYVLFTFGSNPVQTRIEKFSSSGVLEDSTSIANGAQYLAASENRVYVTGYAIGMCSSIHTSTSPLPAPLVQGGSAGYRSSRVGATT